MPVRMVWHFFSSVRDDNDDKWKPVAYASIMYIYIYILHVKQKPLFLGRE